MKFKAYIALIFGILFFFFGTEKISAQRYAYVDTEYILENIPAYKDAQEKLNELSEKWQQEIEEKYEEIDKLYRSMQAEEVLLTDDMKKKREKEIERKEKEVQKLQKKRFGKNGDLYQKRKELIQPIQDNIYSAIKDLAESRNYTVIFDTSSKSSILYSSEKYDKSDEIIKKLGYTPGAVEEDEDEKSKQEK